MNSLQEETTTVITMFSKLSSVSNDFRMKCLYIGDGLKTSLERY